MICDYCSREATILIVDHKRVEVPQQLRPGMIIPCDEPRTAETYCEDCWILRKYELFW